MQGEAITAGQVFLFLAVIGAVGGLWWRIEGKFSDADAARQKLADDLSAHKLYVVQNHASTDALREMERRLVAAMDKLADRLEAVVARLDAAANRQSRE